MSTKHDQIEVKREARIRLGRAVNELNEALEALSPGSEVTAILTSTDDAGRLGSTSPRPIAELGVRRTDAGMILFTELDNGLMGRLAEKGRAEAEHYRLMHHGEILGFEDEWQVQQ